MAEVQVKYLPFADWVIPPSSNVGTIFNVNRGELMRDGSLFHFQGGFSSPSSTYTFYTPYLKRYNGVIHKMRREEGEIVTDINQKSVLRFNKSTYEYLEVKIHRAVSRATVVTVTEYSTTSSNPIINSTFYLDDFYITDVYYDIDMVDMTVNLQIKLNTGTIKVLNGNFIYPFTESQPVTIKYTIENLTFNNSQKSLTKPLFNWFFYIDMDKKHTWEDFFSNLNDSILYPIYNYERTEIIPTESNSRMVKNMFRQRFIIDADYKFNFSEHYLWSKTLYLVAEKIGVLDYKLKTNILKNLSSFLFPTDKSSVNTCILKYFDIRLYLTMSTIERIRKKNFVYFFRTQDSETKKFHKRILEKLNITSFFSRKAKFKKNYSENILKVAEKRNSVIKKNGRSTISLKDIIVRNVDMVVSSVMFSNKVYDIDEFKNVYPPVEYEAFKELLPSDYTYKEALIRIVMENSITSESVPYLDTWKLIADVPDIYDTGVSNVLLTQPLKVYFQRDFHILPTISAMVIGGGEEAVNSRVSIGDITTTHFFMYVYDQEDNQVPAKVSWQAQGY